MQLKVFKWLARANGPIMAERDCMRLGMVLAALSLLGCLALVLLAVVLCELAFTETFHWTSLYTSILPSWGRELLRVLASAGPVALAVGGFNGYWTYRVAAGANAPVRSASLVFFICAVLGMLVMPVSGMFMAAFVLLGVQALRRHLILQQDKPPGLLMVALHFSLTATVFVFLKLNASHHSSQFTESMLGALLFSAGLSALITDSLLVNAVRVFRAEKQLAPPSSFKTQFGLGTLLAATLLLGAWLTGLVWAFHLGR